MKQRHEIQNQLGSNLYSVQIYDDKYFTDFKFDAVFEKWATVEVASFDCTPPGMERFVINGGTYAVFQHTGAAQTGAKMFQYIMATWMPNSEYCLDNRPHFEILGEKYRNDDPSSEEEIWIPVKLKNVIT